MLVEGRTVKDEWEDADDNERTTFKIEARAWHPAVPHPGRDAQRQDAGRRPQAMPKEPSKAPKKPPRADSPGGRL